MNYEQFIESHIRNINQTVIPGYIVDKELDYLLTKYRRSEYTDLLDLIKLTKDRILQYDGIATGCDSSHYAGFHNISRQTARKRLSSLRHIKCNKEKRPYIYTIDDD